MKNREAPDITGTGVVYLAFGAPYLAMAVVSAASLRRTNPDMPICMVTNVCRDLSCLDFWDERLDSVRFVDADEADNRTVKTEIFWYSPFEKTFFIDCDTVVLGSLQQAALYLDYFDICMKQKTTPQNKPGKGDLRVLNERIPVRDLPHWNSGVVFFRRNERVEQFFRNWSESFASLGVGYDQVSLVEAVFRSECKLLSLDVTWNRQTGRKTMRRRPGVRIVHYASDIDGEMRRAILDASGEMSRCGLVQDLREVHIFLRSRNEQRTRKKGAVSHAIRNAIAAIKVLIDEKRGKARRTF